MRVLEWGAIEFGVYVSNLNRNVKQKYFPRTGLGAFARMKSNHASLLIYTCCNTTCIA